MVVNAEPAVCSLGLPATCRSALFGRAMGSGACGRCAAEIAQGTRPQSQQCYAFSGAFDGASVCQTCGHSWHDHG